MKKLICLLLGILLLSGCAQSEVVSITKSKPVEVMAVESKRYPIELQYLGTVESDEVKKYAFLTGGVLEDITVRAGDNVTSNQILATLERDKLSISVSTAQEQTRAAQLIYAKAREQFNFYNKLLVDTKALLDAGATSKQQYDEVKLKRDVAQKELSQAAAGVQQARLQADYNKDNADDATLFSDTNGTVLSVEYKKGEIVPQGHPVVIVRSKVNTINVGMTAEDVKRVNIGDAVTISNNGKPLGSASISRIHYVPDAGSRTYSVEISMEDDGTLLLGESVDVAVAIGQADGVWLPIANILNDGQDYVYTVVDGRAKRVDLTVDRVYRDLVKVSGMQPGEQLIVSGTQSLADGYRVIVVNAEEQTTGSADE